MLFYPILLLMFEFGFARAHFIIDKRGILRHMSVTDTLVGRGTDELLRIVKALQYVDEVEEAVPADWSQPSE